MEEGAEIDMRATARALVVPGKGVLAADESSGTMDKRLEAVLDAPPTAAARLAFRELVFTAAGAGEHISGAILYGETIRQSTREGIPIPELLSGQGIIPGIKVDTGAKPLAGAEGEKVTEGLDGLRDRLAAYRDLGARVAAGRAVIAIGAELPSSTCVHVNAHALGRYAALCQEAGLVPIVEPEVLMDGGHTIESSAEVTSLVIDRVFAELRSQRVDLEAILLKPNMVLSGYDRPEQASTEEVAQRTLACLREVVPATVPGIVFLSGGQSDAAASAHLDAMNRIGEVPWELSFSYGRALQASALASWRGAEANVAAAQAVYLRRVRCTGAARAGRYTADLEREPEHEHEHEHA